MAPRLFGTDGVRGIANKELTNELAYRLGQAAAIFMGGIIVVGKDTRLSGDMLEASVSAGIMSVGGTAMLAGIIPTPGVALLVRTLHANGGVMISASHNPPEYNGIKIFDAEGFKLPDELEDRIQSFIEAGGAEAYARATDKTGVQETLENAENEAGTFSSQLVSGDQVGVAVPIEGACELYIDHVVDSIRDQELDFSGLHIALDVGHGASALTSARAFERLGAQVSVINNEFNGTDINVDCGSTHLEPLRELMMKSGADVGVAHDGDADRVILMTPEGEEIDGDIIEVICALDMHKRGLLAHNTVVTTVLCNMGFMQAMREAGINVVQTKVGDRYVLEAMQEHGYSIGGEQSGHMILLEHNSTGDGLMTASQFLAAILRSGKPLSKAIQVMTRFPQTLVNVKVTCKDNLAGNEAIERVVSEVETELGETGRVLIRPSGTEPVIRIMVEASTIEVANEACQRIADVVSREL